MTLHFTTEVKEFAEYQYATQQQIRHQTSYIRHLSNHENLCSIAIIADDRRVSLQKQHAIEASTASSAFTIHDKDVLLCVAVPPWFKVVANALQLYSYL